MFWFRFHSVSSPRSVMVQKVRPPAVQSSSDMPAFSALVHLHRDLDHQVSGIQFLATEFFRITGEPANSPIGKPV
jgi:hypothetical protein